MTRPIPLITAAEGFPEMERVAASARDELLMSFRIFDPTMRLHSPEMKQRGFETWLDLLREVSDRGVRLRILLSDFDPFFTNDLHQFSWSAAHRLRDTLDGDVEVLCAPHGQQAGWFWRLLMRGRLREALQELEARDPKELTPVERAALRGTPSLRPVTIHQKFMIADRERCIIGGLDINERRWDTPDHAQPTEQTWHDVAVRVDGGFAHPLTAHFTETWNSALECGGAPEGFDPKPMPQPDKQAEASAHRLLRTFSAPCPGPSRLSPRTSVKEIEEATLEVIGTAQHSIYLETQFLRHKPVFDALVEAAGRSGTQLIVILPSFADRVLYDGDFGWDARHAHALQVRGLTRLAEAYGDRLALIAPAIPAVAPPDVPSIHGAGPIYIHSKVTLVDESHAIIGSANLNGRSLHWDTEACIHYQDPEAIRHMRTRLAQAWLQEAAEGADITRAETWCRVARANADRRPEDRTGFALPYPLGKVRRFSRLIPFLPDAMF